MSSRRMLRGLAALTMLTSLVAACGDDDDGETTPVEETDDGGAEEAVEAQEVAITGIDYSFSEAPTELEAGLIELTFENEGTVEHEAAFVEIGDTPLEEFLPKFDPVFAGEGGGPLPEETGNLAAPVENAPGESTTVTFTLTEGTYALMCTFDGDAEEQREEGVSDLEDEEEEPAVPERFHYNRGMAQVVAVGPGSGAAELPEADGTITAQDWSFVVDVADGDTAINFENTGPEQIHFAGIGLMPEGTDVATAESSFVGQFSEGGPPEGSVEPEDEEFGFSGVFSSGMGSQFEVEDGFQSGRTYILYCFVQDRAGGPPHAFPEDMGGRGMYQAFTVE
jgi:plastocyanin